jgi:hypothetical protein
MKKKQFLYFGTILIFVVTVFSSCKKDEVFATKTPASGDILFSVPEGALTAPPAGQPQLIQPDFNLVAGRYAITDDLKMTIALTGGLTELTVKALSTSTGATTDKATFSGINGSTELTYPINTLGIGNAAPGPLPASVVLQFNGSNADGSKKTTRVFTVNVVDPFVLTSSNSATANGDSTVTLAYSVPAATTLAGLTNVDVFVKRGKNGIESTSTNKTYSSVLTVSDNVKPKMPPDNITGVLDTMFYRFVAKYATGRTVTKNTTVRFANIPLTKSVTGVVLYNPAITGENSTKIAYDFGKASFNKSTDSDALRDIKITASNADIGFTAGSGNSTRFVKVTTSSLFTSPTFQALSKAFLAGSPVTSVTNAFVGDIYIVEIDGNTGNPASTRYGIMRITSVLATQSADNADNIIFDFKSK